MCTLRHFLLFFVYVLVQSCSYTRSRDQSVRTSTQVRFGISCVKGQRPYFLGDVAPQALPHFFGADFVELAVAVRGVGRLFPVWGEMFCAGARGGGSEVCCLPDTGLDSFPRSTKRSISFSRAAIVAGSVSSSGTPDLSLALLFDALLALALAGGQG